MSHAEYQSHLDAHDGAAANRGAGDAADARSVGEALSALGVGGGAEGLGAPPGDMHPEKRAKAAWAAYQERELPELRADKPGLKLMQARRARGV